MIESFYVTGGTLPDSASCYVERAADAELLKGILSGAYVYVLDSRQMGKSSLCIRTLAKLNEQGVRTAFVDLTKFGVRNITPEQWFVAMLREVGRGLNQAAPMLEYWRSNSDLAPVQRFFGAIQGVALSRIQGRVAIFIDEIDVTRSLPFDTDEFFAGIRQCFIGRANQPDLARLTFSLFGTATPAELIKDTRVSPFNVGHRVELQDFQYDEARILERALPGNSEAVLRRILYWTGGHPYLTQRLCELVAQNGNPDVDGPCRELFFERRAKESDDNLAFVRNRLLKNEEDVVALLEMYGRVRSGKLVRDEETNPLCAVLRMSGVSRVKDGKLNVRNRIYARVFDLNWVRLHLPDAENRRQRAAYRRGILRASAIGGAFASVVGGMAIYGFHQAGIARSALDSAKRLTNSLTETQRDLRTSLRRTTEALAVANTAKLQARSAAALADSQRVLARSAAGRAGIEAVHAQQASVLANSRLSQSLVATAMLRLDANDAGGAVAPLISALNLDREDTRRQEMHRLRLAYALNTALTLRQVWSGAGSMLSAQFLPGGRRVITANADGHVDIWDAKTGKVAGSAMFHRGLTSISVGKDARFLLTGSSTGEVCYWDVSTGHVLRRLELRDPVTLVKLADDGRLAAIGTAKGYELADVLVWDPHSGRVVGHPVHERAPLQFKAFAFAPTDRRLLVGMDNWMAQSVDLGDGQGDHSVSTCFDTVQAMFVHGGQGLLLNGPGPGERFGVVQLCLPTGTPIVKYKSASDLDGIGTAFRISRDGQTIVTATSTGTVQAYDYRSGARKGPAIHAGMQIEDCDLSPNGTLVVAGAVDGTVRAWNVITGEPFGQTFRQGGRINHLEFDASSSRVLTCSEDGTARIWQLRTAGLPETAVGPPAYQGVPYIAWTSHGSLIASDIRHLYRWDGGKRWRLFLPGYRALYAGGWEGQRRRHLFAGSGTLRVYDYDREEFVGPTLRGSRSFPPDQGYDQMTTDCRYLIDEDSPRHFRILDIDRGGVTTGQFRLPYPLPVLRYPRGVDDARFELAPVVLLSRANRILTGDGKSLDLWDLRSGRHIASLAAPNGLSSPHFCPDESIFVAREPRVGLSTLRFFRSTDGQPLPLRVSDAGDAYAWSFNTDGSRFASPDFSSIWDTLTGRRIAVMRSPVPVRYWQGYDTLAMGSILFNPIAGRIYDMQTGRAISPVLLHEVAWNHRLSRDGHYLALGTGSNLYIYDLVRSKLTGPISIGQPEEIYFTPDSRLLITQSVGLIAFWDPATGEKVLPPIAKEEVEAIQELSPDGRTFVCGISGGVVVRQLEPDLLSAASLQAAAEASTRESMEHMNAARWKQICMRLPDVYRPSAASAPSFVTPAAPNEEEYSIDDAVRDSGLTDPDADSLLAAGESAARAARWDSADLTLEQAVNKGAHGSGVDFLRGAVAMRRGNYLAALKAFSRVLGEERNATLPRGERQAIAARAVFQAAVACRDFPAAASALESPFSSEDPVPRLKNLLFATLARAAADTSDGQARFAALIRRCQAGAFPNYEWLLDYLARTGATLQTAPEIGELFVRKTAGVRGASADYPDTDPEAIPAAALTFARAGQERAVEERLTRLAPGRVEPECLMAQALIRRRRGNAAFRQGLLVCADGCRRLVDANDCSTFDASLRVLRALILEREAHDEFASAKG